MLRFGESILFRVNWPSVSTSRVVDLYGIKHLAVLHGKSTVDRAGSLTKFLNFNSDFALESDFVLSILLKLN